jgi:hypothetical protein
MDLKELDARIAAQRDRLSLRPDPAPPVCQHEWGHAYKSSSGRKVCTKCGLVTDPSFESLGVGARALLRDPDSRR